MDKETKFFSNEEILSVMPQQPPFLFVDEAEYRDGEIVGKYKIKPDEVFFKGHFKGNPVFPGTLMLEALGQLCVLGLVEGVFPEMERRADPKKIFFTSTDGGRCMRICRPGDSFEIAAKPTKIRRPMASFVARMSADGQKAAFVEKITLAFDYVS